jgi:heterodisulfide reductase subunit A
VARIGVFICHCGLNIAGTVDVKKVAEEVSKHPDVAHAGDYIFMCSDPGQLLVQGKVQELGLEGLVMANCSPTLHEVTFRRAAEVAGLNPFLVEVANIREAVSWPHLDQPDEATRKAIEVITSIVEKVRQNVELSTIKVPVTRSVMVIGGGVAGIQAALDCADAGLEVHLVERTSSIGGVMASLSETFPTLDCPQCILTPKMTQAGKHPNIRIHAYSEVEEVSGFVGNFEAKVRHKATYIDWDKCTGCGNCMTVCPTKKIPSEYNHGMANRTAAYIPFPQAVPNKAVIDAEHCLWLTKEKCGICTKKCPPEAIHYEDNAWTEELDVGAIIVATGLEVMGTEEFGEYGMGEIPDVVTGLQFERLLAPSGPTAGKVLRPSDGTEPKEVAFLQCIGSRDPANYNAYCSKVCCMYAGKQAMLYRHAVHDGQAYVFYIDIRSDGKGYEEFIQRAMEEEDVLYIRGKVSKVFQDGDKVVVWAVDTLTSRWIELRVDMVVLATASVPSKGVGELASKLRIATDQYGWLKEAHLKLQPMETLTSGIYVAGAAQFVKDITDTVAQASGAAAKAIALLSKDFLERAPLIAAVDQDLCVGCGMCEEFCAYGAIAVDPVTGRAEVNEGLCEGCGGCAAQCPSGAATLTNYGKKQVFDMISSFINGQVV